MIGGGLSTKAPASWVGWQRYTRVQQFTQADIHDVVFNVAGTSSPGASVFTKGVLVVDLTAFDAAHGTALATYPAADLDAILSPEVLGPLSLPFSFGAPTSGTWTQGEIVWTPDYTNSGAGGPVGWACVAAGSPGIWAPIGNRGFNDTAANIASIAAAVNTYDKFIGKQVLDTTNHRLMIASGPAAADAWYRADGAVSVVPA